MQSNVIPIGKERARREKNGPMPEQFPLDQVERLLKLAGQDAFTWEQVQYATRSVRAWYLGDPARRRRTDWVMVILNSLRMQWGLRGFAKWRERTGNTRDTALHAKQIENLLERVRRKRGEA